MKLILNICAVVVSLIGFSFPVSAQIGKLEYLPNNVDDYTEYHKVKDGETLYKISQQYNVSVDYLQSLNELDSHIIFPGQSLKVKEGSKNTSNQRVTNRSVSSSVSRTGISEETRLRNLEKLKEEDFSSNSSQRVGQNDWPTEGKGEYATIERREYYQVKIGDDINSIAKKHKVSANDIKSWNPLGKFYPGETIIVGKKYEDVAMPDNAPNEAEEEFRNRRVAERNIKDLNQDLGADPEEFTTTGSLADLNKAGKMEDLNNPKSSYRKYTTTNSSLGNTVEIGSFGRFVDPDYKVSRFYATHKTLPPGSKVSMLIPGNSGFVEVEIIRTLSPFNQSMIELSPACLDLIDGAGGAETITIIY